MSCFHSWNSDRVSSIILQAGLQLRRVLTVPSFPLRDAASVRPSRESAVWAKGWALRLLRTNG